MTDIVWETPPTSQSGPRQLDLVEFAQALRERPGEWARWPRPITGNAASAAATRVNAGFGVFGDRGNYEAVTRTVDGQRIAFVRYIGEAREGAA